MIDLKKLGFSKYWLLLFLVINSYSALRTYVMGEFESSGYENLALDSFDLFVAWLVVILSHIIILVPFFLFLSSLRVPKICSFTINEYCVVGSGLGYTLLVLQCVYCINNLVYGSGIAGAGSISGGPLSYIFIIFDPDFLFIVYYAAYRENKMFTPNLVVYAFSGLARGWNGIFLAIIYFETCRLYRLKKLNLFRIFATLLIVLTLYPLLSSTKWVIRANAVRGVDWVEVVTVVSSQLSADDYVVLIRKGIEHLVSRIESVTIAYDMANKANLLEEWYQQGRFQPFWLEGLHGVFFERILSGKGIKERSERWPLGVVYGDTLDVALPDGVIGNYAVTYFGWIYTLPSYLPFYLGYTFFLCFASMLLVRIISSKPAALEMAWYAWLVYLLAPWLGAMIKLIYTLVIFLISQILFLILHQGLKKMEIPPLCQASCRA